MIEEEANSLIRGNNKEFDFEKEYMDGKNFVLLAELLNSIAI